MNQLHFFGKHLILFGVLFIVLGAIFIFADKIPFLGRLPGDIFVKKENFSFYFPLATCIILSIILTVLLNLFSKK